MKEKIKEVEKGCGKKFIGKNTLANNICGKLGEGFCFECELTLKLLKEHQTSLQNLKEKLEKERSMKFSLNKFINKAF